MRVRIHRGAQQVGGTCVEIEANGKRLVLDVGLPLDTDDTDDRQALLPDVKGFREKDADLLGVVISHPHQDHYGLVDLIESDTPILIGDARVGY